MLQSNKLSCLNRESWPILVGKISILLPLRSNTSNEDRQSISSGISFISQPLNCSRSNEESLLILVGSTQPLHLSSEQPIKLNCLSPCRFSNEGGSSLTPVLSKSSVSKSSIFSKISGKPSRFEQKARRRLPRDFSLQILVETLFSLSQRRKSKVSRLVRHSIDEGTSSIGVYHNLSLTTFPEICGNSVRLTHQAQSISMGDLK